MSFRESSQLLLCLWTMEEYEAVYRYLENNGYPDVLSKDTKRNFRRKCNENFNINNVIGQLYHRKCDRQKIK